MSTPTLLSFVFYLVGMLTIGRQMAIGRFFLPAPE